LSAKSETCYFYFSHIVESHSNGVWCSDESNADMWIVVDGDADNTAG